MNEYIDIVMKLVNERNACLDLLAIIHGDGGQYTGEHGVEKSVEDAIEKIISKQIQIEELKGTVEFVWKHLPMLEASWDGKSDPLEFALDEFKKFIEKSYDI